jgi:heme/copper-type cytochrome/quinol oxidase subunit 2
MNYLIIKLYTVVFGINKVLAARSGFDAGNQGTGGNGKPIELPNPLGGGNTTIAQLINNIAYYLSVYIAPPIVTLMILFAAFQILTAGDNPEKLTSAKNMILWTVIGYVIILIAWGITSIIQQLLRGY